MNPTDPWPCFNESHVFVAGGTSGINLGIALGFARSGATLSVLGRNAEKAAAAAAELSRHSPAQGYTADVRDPEALKAAFAQAVDASGPIDVLVSGAAGNFPAAALGMSTNAFKAVVDIDLLGGFNVLRLGHAHLRIPGASVITISAPQAIHPTPLQAHVCAAKAGADMLLRVLALEWGRQGIRLNAIMPGPIADTEGMRRLAPTPEATERAAATNPLGRLGTCDDVAAAALFLASPLASYITGAVLPVDGGMSLGSGLAMLG